MLWKSFVNVTCLVMVAWLEVLRSILWVPCLDGEFQRHEHEDLQSKSVNCQWFPLKMFLCFLSDPFCRTNGDGRYTTDNTCKNHFQCISGFRTNVGVCQTGTYYDTALGFCTSQLPSGCVAEAFCSGRQDGNYRRDSVCETYYQCSGQQDILRTCQSGTLFNDITKQCESGVPTGCQGTFWLCATWWLFWGFVNL